MEYREQWVYVYGSDWNFKNVICFNHAISRRYYILVASKISRAFSTTSPFSSTSDLCISYFCGFRSRILFYRNPMTAMHDHVLGGLATLQTLCNVIRHFLFKVFSTRIDAAISDRYVMMNTVQRVRVSLAPNWIKSKKRPCSAAHCYTDYSKGVLNVLTTAQKSPKWW